MDPELVCKWLGLPAASWPPDHYTLLGLPVGEGDVRKIEEHAHDRLARLRQYQLNHPEQVTEAMNRLAQAFSCLTDPKQKQAYDAALRPAPAVTTALRAESTRTMEMDAAATMEVAAARTTPPAPPTVPPVEPASAPSHDPLAWLFGPWSAPAVSEGEAPAPAPGGPIVADWKAAPPPARLPPSAETPATPPAIEPAAPPAPPEPADPLAQAARFSTSARSGLGTRRALYHRLVTTRQLIHNWKKIGRYLAQPQRRLTRLAEANDLVKEFGEIQELLEDFPRLLGEAGQPGYLVLALAKQPMVVPTFRALGPSQREALARDWNTALNLLFEHRHFLRDELRSLRRQGIVARAMRVLRSFWSDHALAVVSVGSVAVVLAATWVYHRYLR